MGGRWGEREVYWATVAYVRGWWWTDGVRLSVTRARGLEPDMLRAIAIDYNVNRGVTAGKNNAAALCAFLNAERERWPQEGLVARAGYCRALAERAAARKLTPSIQVSAMTKFMWFLRPEGWTVYDRFAATGAGVPKHLDTRARMEKFYHRLAGWGFEDRAAAMQAVIDDSPLKGLPATRILDRLLMARDETYPYDPEQELNGFLSLLPAGTHAEVAALAERLQDAFGGEIFPHADKRKAA